MRWCGKVQARQWRKETIIGMLLVTQVCDDWGRVHPWTLLGMTLAHARIKIIQTDPECPLINAIWRRITVCHHNPPMHPSICCPLHPSFAYNFLLYIYLSTWVSCPNEYNSATKSNARKLQRVVMRESKQCIKKTLWRDSHRNAHCSNLHNNNREVWRK